MRERDGQRGECGREREGEGEREGERETERERERGSVGERERGREREREGKRERDRMVESGVRGSLWEKKHRQNFKSCSWLTHLDLSCSPALLSAELNACQTLLRAAVIHFASGR